MTTIEFEVDGTAAPQGSKSYKGKSKAGTAIMVESSVEVGPWRDRVLRAAMLAKVEKARELELPGWIPFDGPLTLDITFWLPRPNSAPKTIDVYPIRKPDLSKIVRSTEDALTDAALVTDDARFVALSTVKLYAVHRGFDRIFVEGHHREQPGAIIRVSTIP